MASPFTAAHRLYVKSLYRRTLKDSLDWTIQRDIWRGRALQIRARFEANRNVRDPRALALIIERAEAKLAAGKHPDPVIVPSFPGGTKWERNTPPSMEPVYDHLEHAADLVWRKGTGWLEPSPAETLSESAEK